MLTLGDVEVGQGKEELTRLPSEHDALTAKALEIL
jgi:hypothetical protein